MPLLYESFVSKTRSNTLTAQLAALHLPHVHTIYIISLDAKIRMAPQILRSLQNYLRRAHPNWFLPQKGIGIRKVFDSSIELRLTSVASFKSLSPFVVLDQHLVISFSPTAGRLEFRFQQP